MYFRHCDGIKYLIIYQWKKQIPALTLYHKMFQRETPKQPFYKPCCNVKCCKRIGHPPKIAAGRFKEKTISFKTHVNVQIKASLSRSLAQIQKGLLKALLCSNSLRCLYITLQRAIPYKSSCMAGVKIASLILSRPVPGKIGSFNFNFVLLVARNRNEVKLRMPSLCFTCLIFQNV